MSRYSKNVSLVLTTGAVFAFSFAPLFAQDDPSNKAPEPPQTQTEEASESTEEADSAETDESNDAKASASNGDEIELDENDEQTDSTVDRAAVDAALSGKLDDGVKENSAEDLLNLATEMKLSATNLLDLTKVIALCEEAEKKGLDETNGEFAKQLRISARLERGLAISQLFMNPDLPLEQLPRGWEALRDKAIEDIETTLAETPDVPVAQLAVGRLYMLAEKEDKANAAFDAAIGSADAEPPVKALALKFRAGMEKDETKAVELLEKAIEISPEAADLRAQLAGSFLSSNRLDEATTQIDKAIELDDKNVEFKKIKANILAAADRIDEARRLFDEATKDAGDNLLVQIEKGQFLASIREYDEAIAHFTGLIAQYDAPGFYFFRAVLYLQTKKFDEALADVNKALRQDSSMLQALRLKGIIYLEQKKYDDAIRIFQQLKRKSDNKTEATTQIAFATAKKGLYKNAAEILDAELAKNPDSVDVLRSYADMELMFGHWTAARDKYARLLKLSPKDSGVLNNYSWLLSTCPDDSIRNGEKALEYGKLAAEKTFFAAPHILSTLAAAYAELGDFEKAREWSQKAVDLGEKQQHESLEDLKKELESYKEEKPWRETAEQVEELDEKTSETPEAPNVEDADKNDENAENAGVENADKNDETTEKPEEK